MTGIHLNLAAATLHFWELVGATGEVIGADRSPVALEVARARADAGSHRNVFFRHGDPTEMMFLIKRQDTTEVEMGLTFP
jgi:ubiquinone/menaquinone biosynthesis C-methylase UbiE